MYDVVNLIPVLATVGIVGIVTFLDMVISPYIPEKYTTIFFVGSWIIGFIIIGILIFYFADIGWIEPCGSDCNMTLINLEQG